MAKIRCGMYEYTIKPNGEIVWYKATMAIPAVLQNICFESRIMKRGNRVYYVIEGPTWESVHIYILAMQVEVNVYKTTMFQSKLDNALAELAEIKSI